MKSTRCVVLMMSVLASRMFAQEVTFVASVEQTTVGSGEQFSVSFTISGPDASGAQNFKGPNFGQLVVLTGPNTSSQMQIVNGRVSASMTYSYDLYARQPGKYPIGPATVEYNGKTLQTKPLQIDVVQGKPQQMTQRPGQDTVVTGDYLFIRTTSDKQRVTMGEQVTITYKIYTRVGISSYNLPNAPVYQGFWAEDLEQPRQATLTNEMVNGKQYRVATIKTTALFPTQTGKLTVAPLEIRCAVQMQARRRSNNPFDTFFNDPFFSRLQTVEQNFKSNPLSITVDPLPGNAPREFAGAVGRYTMNVTIDKKQVMTGDPVTLRITVSGSGNVKLLALPKPALPADFEAYEPKVSDETTREGGVIRGKKVAEYLLIPRNPGQRAIEPMTFVYYDLGKRSYSTLHSPRFELSVMQGKGVGSGANIASKSGVRLLGEDIRFLKLTPGKLRPVDESPFAVAWFTAGVLLPPFLFVGALAYRKRKEKLSGNVQRLRFEKAVREANKRLKYARKILAQGNTESYHAEVSKALMGYLEDKLHIPRATLTVDEAVQKLQIGGVSTDTANALKGCFERAEFARFAPSSDTQETRIELLEKAAEAINTIEKSFTGRA
jgi:hypothetical protein